MPVGILSHIFEGEAGISRGVCGLTLSAEQMTKATLGPHAGAVLNRMSFAEAYAHVRTNPHTTYQTTGDQMPFTARAIITSKGNHQGQEALRLAPHNEYIYECCWGHKTNCAGSHIDCYSAAIG